MSDEHLPPHYFNLKRDSSAPVTSEQKWEGGLKSGIDREMPSRTANNGKILYFSVRDQSEDSSSAFRKKNNRCGLFLTSFENVSQNHWYGVIQKSETIQSQIR